LRHGGHRGAGSIPRARGRERGHCKRRCHSKARRRRALEARARRVPAPCAATRLDRRARRFQRCQRQERRRQAT
jgi:hypothetical protein